MPTNTIDSITQVGPLPSRYDELPDNLRQQFQNALITLDESKFSAAIVELGHWMLGRIEYEVKVRISGFQTETANLRKKLKDLEALLGDFQKESAILRRDLDALRNGSRQVQNELNELNGSRARLISEVQNELNGHQARWISEVVELAARVSALEKAAQNQPVLKSIPLPILPLGERIKNRLAERGNMGLSRTQLGDGFGPAYKPYVEKMTNDREIFASCHGRSTIYRLMEFLGQSPDVSDLSHQRGHADNGSSVPKDEKAALSEEHKKQIHKVVADLKAQSVSNSDIISQLRSQYGMTSGQAKGFAHFYRHAQ